MSVNTYFGDLLQVNGKIWNGVPVDQWPESLLGLGWRSFESDGRPVLKSRVVWPGVGVRDIPRPSSVPAFQPCGIAGRHGTGLRNTDILFCLHCATDPVHVSRTGIISLPDGNEDHEE